MSIVSSSPLSGTHSQSDSVHQTFTASLIVNLSWEHKVNRKVAL